MPMVREFFTKDEINAKLSRMYAKTEITFFYGILFMTV